MNDETTIGPEVEQAAPAAAEAPEIAQTPPAAVEATETPPAEDQGTEVEQTAPAAVEATETPPAEDQGTEAVEPSDATPAASEAQDGQPAEGETEETLTQTAQAEPESPIPSPESPSLESSLAAEKEKSASLLSANDLLQGQLKGALKSLDRAQSAMRAEILALADKLHDEVWQFQQRAESVEIISAAGVRVFLRQPAIVAGEAKEIGATLGIVALASGVSLNFLVDAVRNGIARASS